MSLLRGAGALADDMNDRVQAALELEGSMEIVAALRRDARRGNLKAAHKLGLIYLDGRHVELDPVQAHAMFEMAGERNLYRDRYKLGYAESQFELGRMNEEGIGVKRDPGSAAEWYERAAEQGHAPAQVALAQLYADESTPPSEFDAAFFWALLAVSSYRLDENDRADARRILETARSRLTPVEVNSLRHKAANWSPAMFGESG